MGGTISITGLGILCAIGNDRQAVLGSLLRKESGIGPMKYLRSKHTDIPVGEIKLSTDEMKQMLGIDTREPVSRTSVMGALAVREALQQAGVRDLATKRVALISGTTVGVMDVTEQYFERMKTEPELQYLPHSNECGRSTEEIAQYSGLAGAKCCTICTSRHQPNLTHRRPRDRQVIHIRRRQTRSMEPEIVQQTPWHPDRS